jgi:hypothetical protein
MFLRESLKIHYWPKVGDKFRILKLINLKHMMELIFSFIRLISLSSFPSPVLSTTPLFYSDFDLLGWHFMAQPKETDVKESNDSRHI